MIRRSIVTLAAGCLIALPATAGTDPEPKEIIRQGIAAMGGIETLRQVRATYSKFTDRLHLEGESIDVEGETWLQFPDRFKQIAHADIGGIKLSLQCIVRGPDVWLIKDGVPEQLEGQKRADLCEDLYEEYIATLWPLLEDPSFTLTTTPVKTVSGRPANGVRVAKPKRPDVTLFFDQESHLLVLKQRLRHDPDEPNHSQLGEELISDYRDIDFRIDDENRLRQAGIDMRDSSLLAFLKKQILSEAGRARCQKLIDQLGNASYTIRKNARQELAKFGPCVVPLLRSAVKSQDLEVSTAANELLQKASAESTSTGSIPAAIRLLADHRTPGAIEVILAYLPGASSDLLSSAAQKALADLSTNQGKPNPSLVKALANADPVVRAMARAALEAARRPPAPNTSQQLFLKSIKFPFRFDQSRDGKKSHELKILDVDFYSQLADSLFASPP
jgi:hypothetical protein